MTITSGTKLGPYEILSAIGAGGMGEVYKARDTRLNRTVAIKVLPSHFSDNAEMKARFDREAQAIAGLNHPHICVLYDVGHQDVTDYLVMEYLEGLTLAQRLEKGALPLDEGLKIAIEIADALDKAHRQGVVHRDLKPSNVMLTKSGAKLLDFGLAKLQLQKNASSLSMMPTNAEVTAPGTILGSLQYMSPEQLEGGEADARTDIFALGAILFEMVTGRKAFQGKSQVSLIGAILKDTPPPVSQFQRVAPPALDRLISTCLAKDPDDRWQSAGDLRRELPHISKEQKMDLPSPAFKRARREMPLVLGFLIAAIAALLGGLAAWNLRPDGRVPVAPIARLAITLPSGDQLVNTGFTSIALSSDGSKVAYAATRNGVQQIYVRALDEVEVKPIAGTEGAYGPFFSPDGQWVGFFQQGKLKKVPATGGVSQVLGEAQYGLGADWCEDDNIYFAPSPTSGIWKVDAAGKRPEPITKINPAKGEIDHRHPKALPGCKALLFTVRTGGSDDNSYVNLQLLETGEQRLIVQGAQTGRFSLSGHIVASRQGRLIALPFSLTNLRVVGNPPAPLAEYVVRTGEGSLYGLSPSGSLAYVPGGPNANNNRVAWVDRNGKAQTFSVPQTQAINEIRLSPDGRLAATTSDGGIRIYDFARGFLTPFVLNTPGSQAPIWTPDGARIIYRGTRAGSRNLYWKDVNGTKEEERLTTSNNTQTPQSFSPDGKWLAFQESDSRTGLDIWLLPLQGQRKAQAFLKTAFNELNPQFSPDSRFLAYVSDESGRNEVYVQPFLGPGARFQISTEGGTDPVWSRNGRELFYLNGDKMMAVDIVTQPSFTARSPRTLFQGRYRRSSTFTSSFDVALDGRFLMVPDSLPEEATTQINIVLNWTEELKQRVPVK
jgi:serine/threonine-protein kinase